jgi:hypothetical protein
MQPYEGQPPHQYPGQPQSGDSQPHSGYAEQYDPSGQATPQSTTYDDWDVPTMPRSNSGRTLIIAIVGLLVLGGATTGVMYSLGWFSDEASQDVTGTWVLGGENVEFSPEGEFTSDDGESGAMTWRTEGKYLYLDLTLTDENQETWSRTMKFRYVIVDDVLFLNMLSTTVDGETTEVEEAEGYCIGLVRESIITLSEDEDYHLDRTDPPSWCNLDNSLASDQPESGTRNSYTADDANAAISTGNTDTLMSIRWQHAEDDLNWAFVSIKLTVGDNTYDCSIDGLDDCAIAQDGDDAGLWQVGEFLTLSENVADICGGAGEDTCDVNIHVTYRGSVVAGTSDVALS